MKILFKRTQDEEESKNIIWKVWSIFEIILNFLRDFTVPMAEYDSWNRNLGSLYPLTVPIAFFFLNGQLHGTDDSTQGTEEREDELDEAA